MSGTEPSTELRALVVDDEKEVADAYALRLRGFCEVETVYTGADALATVEDSTVDVILLDRHMPGTSGDDVLAELDERGFEGRVIMVTAVDPDFDVLELPFDDYLCKPVDREDLRAAVDHQRRVLAYETLGAYFSAASTLAVLQRETDSEARTDHEGYQTVARRAARLERRARRLLGDRADLIDEFERIEREGL